MKRSVLPLVVAVLVALLLLLGVVFWLTVRSGRPQPAPEVHRYPEQHRRERLPRPEGHHSLPPPESGTVQGPPSNCPGIACASTYFAKWILPAAGSCRTTIHGDYPEPDPRCTPGGVVPGLTVATLRDPAWSTKCIRNCQSTEKQKHVVYGWYGIPAPSENNGANQVCELDHLVPLELGGADGLGNIWPQCGPDEATLRERFFKQKDIVENYLAAQVKEGAMPLEQAQRGIAKDWVQYLQTARAVCRGERCGPERTEY